MAAKSTTDKKASTRSGNPAKKAAAKKAAADRQPKKQAAPKAASSSADFKKRVQGQLLRLPSDLVVKARRVELETLVTKGNVPNSLMDVVQESLKKGQSADIASMVGVDEGEIDLQMVTEMFEMVNEVVVTCVVEPKILPEPEDGEAQDDDLLYVSDIDPVDKMFIYQWSIGGTDDVEQFRREAGADLASLAEIQGGSTAA